LRKPIGIGPSAVQNVDVTAATIDLKTADNMPVRSRDEKDSS
jgi:hypothetical protein